MHSTTTAAAPRLLRLKEVIHLTGLSRSTIYAKMEDGTFPCQRKITPAVAVWSEAEVIAWIAAVLAQANDAAPTAAQLHTNGHRTATATGVAQRKRACISASP